MITFSDGNPGKGLSYYQKDSYYQSQDQAGTWCGEGAKFLNVHGEIKTNDFQQILNGFSPEGTSLVQNSGDETRRAYTDCTISAPKSVSLMAIHDPRIETAHQRAVEKALEEIEKRYSYTRKGKGGTQEILNGNLTIAEFHHRENRNMEPHLHTHCLIMNLTRDHDEKWTTTRLTHAVEDQRFLRALYDNELKYELHKLGYETRQSSRIGGQGKRITDSFEILGVSDTVIEKYSSRTNEINEGIQKRMDSGADVDRIDLYNEQKLKTRKAKNRRGAAELADELKESVKREEELSCLKPQPIPLVSKSSAQDIIDRALEDISETRSAFREVDLLRHAMLLSINESVPFQELYNSFQERAIPLKRDLFTTKEIKEASYKVLNLAENGQFKSDLSIPLFAIEEYLEKVEKEGVQFQPGQRQAILEMVSSRDSVNIIQGDAGTGKTFAVEHMKAIFENNNIKMRGFAPTGKASTELESVGLPAATLDSFFLAAKNKPDSIYHNEVWVLDESSMVGSIKMARFLELAEQYNAKVLLLGDVKQLQSVEAGRLFDDLQNHTSITRSYMGERIRQKTEHLKEIVTYSNEGDSERAVRALVNSKSIREVKSKDERIERVAHEIVQDRIENKSSFILAQTNRERRAINEQVRKNLLEKGMLSEGHSQEVFSSAAMTKQSRRSSHNYESGQVLFTAGRAGSLPAGTQATILSVNQEMNSIGVKFWDKKENVYREDNLQLSHCGNQLNVFNVEEKSFAVDDEIIFLKNDKKLKVTNGTLGKVKSISPNGDIEISVKGKKDLISFNIRSEYNYLDHGYALTTYKSQGATVDKVICTTDTETFKTNSNEFYVAVTRAKNKISFYTDSIAELIKQAGIKQEKESIFDYKPPTIQDKLNRKTKELSNEIKKDTRTEAPSISL